MPNTATPTVRRVTEARDTVDRETRALQARLADLRTRVKEDHDLLAEMEAEALSTQMRGAGIPLAPSTPAR